MAMLRTDYAARNGIVCVPGTAPGLLPSAGRIAGRDQSASRANTIDAAIGVAADIVTNCRTCDRTGSQHDAGPGNATDGIADIAAIHDGSGRCRIERDACKPEQGACGDS